MGWAARATWPKSKRASRSAGCDMSTDSTGLLVLRDIVVSFDGFRVLDDLSMTIARGELRFLIGPNGAGKTTLMDVISGKIRASSGSATFDGDVDLTRLSE